MLEDFALPPQTFDRIEIKALVLGLNEVRHMGDPALADAAVSVLAKVAATLPDEREQQMFHAVSQVYRPNARYGFAIDMEALRESCWVEEAVAIRYRNEHGAQTERTIYTLSLAYSDRLLAVLTCCCTRQDFRIFRADRIQAAVRNGESFRPRRASLLRSYLEQLKTARS